MNTVTGHQRSEAHSMRSDIPAAPTAPARQTQAGLPTGELDRLHRLFVLGMPFDQLARVFHLGHKRIKELCADLERPHFKNLDDDSVLRARRRYANDETSTIASIARELGVSPFQLRNALRGVSFRGVGGPITRDLRPEPDFNEPVAATGGS